MLSGSCVWVSRFVLDESWSEGKRKINASLSLNLTRRPCPLQSYPDQVAEVLDHRLLVSIPVFDSFTSHQIVNKNLRTPIDLIYQMLLNTTNASPLVRHRSFTHPCNECIRAGQLG